MSRAENQVSRIAVLMTVHNRREKTMRALDNLNAQKLPEGLELTVFLTDDGCIDGTAEAVKREYPRTVIIKGDGNLFWNGGMRKAWEAAVAQGDFDAYLWLNDDTFLKDNALHILMDAHNDKPRAIIVGASHATDNPGKVTYGGMDNKERNFMPEGSLQECHTFNGNIVLVPDSVYRLLGNLDGVYSHSLGDIDYGLMAREKGIKAFQTGCFVGECDRNPAGPRWLDTTLPVIKRIRILFSPLGYTNPPEYFHYKLKHWGLKSALLSMFSIALHFISPGIWKKIHK